MRFYTVSSWEWISNSIFIPIHRSLTIMTLDTSLAIRSTSTPLQGLEIVLMIMQNYMHHGLDHPGFDGV